MSCACIIAIARHLAAECPAFDPVRHEATRRSAVPPAFWHEAPRVTLKTGWITLGAAPSPHRRAELQTAVCIVGIVALVRCRPVAW